MQLRNRRALAAELVLGALPLAGAIACMALCLPAADAAPPSPPPIRAIRATPFIWYGHSYGSPNPEAWVLVSDDAIHLGATRVSPDAEQWIARDPQHPELRANYFGDRTDIEIAASSVDGAPVSCQELATTISTAMHAGFEDVRIDPPQELPDQPHHCDPEPSPHPDDEPWVLVSDDGIEIYARFIQERWIPREAPDPDAAWRALEAELRQLHTDYAVDKVAVQLWTPDDGEPPATYQDLVSATDAAHAAGLDYVRN
jgi:hypothetical protein